MRLTGTVVREVVKRPWNNANGSGVISSLRVADDTTGEVIEVSAFDNDPRIDTARKGDTFESDLSNISMYKELVQVQLVPMDARLSPSSNGEKPASLLKPAAKA